MNNYLHLFVKKPSAVNLIKPIAECYFFDPVSEIGRLKAVQASSAKNYFICGDLLIAQAAKRWIQEIK
ncbi:MAG: hypothetical protein QF770_06955 [Candidatus Marinimicrobia bacterium]|nr:hypothetical protein [Candidatus Neomarinimicrobiota bacterium]